MDAAEISVCAIVPVYDHEHAIGRVVERLLKLGLPVLLVDDGSHADCARVLDELTQRERVMLIRLPHNGGKGIAVCKGLLAAQAAGYTHAIQVDADGQHVIEDAPRFVEEARRLPRQLICGRPIFDASIPKARYYGRYLTHVLVWVETLSLEIRDSMCGFRLYPLAQAGALIGSKHIGARMDFDTEMIVRWYWEGYRTAWLPTRVVYPLDGVSHFRMVLDNARMVGLHVRLLAGMLIRVPWLLRQRLAGKAEAERSRGVNA
jgi:glycosyltransferase involved in cell wall biosynthesis